MRRIVSEPSPASVVAQAAGVTVSSARGQHLVSITDQDAIQELAHALACPWPPDPGRHLWTSMDHRVAIRARDGEVLRAELARGGALRWPSGDQSAVVALEHPEALTRWLDSRVPAPLGLVRCGVGLPSVAEYAWPLDASARLGGPETDRVWRVHVDGAGAEIRALDRPFEVGDAVRTVHRLDDGDVLTLGPRRVRYRAVADARYVGILEGEPTGVVELGSGALWLGRSERKCDLVLPREPSASVSGSLVGPVHALVRQSEEGEYELLHPDPEAHPESPWTYLVRSGGRLEAVSAPARLAPADRILIGPHLLCFDRRLPFGHAALEIG